MCPWRTAAAFRRKSLSIADAQRSALLILDAGAQTVDAFRPDPAVDEAAIVSDLESDALDGFDEVQVFRAAHLAKDDVADTQRRVIGGLNRAELTWFDLPFHGIAARTKLHGFALAKTFDVVRSPTHH
jgi:hypothetical protein